MHSHQEDAEKFTDIYLCAFCFAADAKRGDDAQVVSCEEYTLEDSVSCDACFVSLKTEKEETKHKK